MPLRTSELHRSLWRSCDELRGGMDASQYKDYILTLLFVKYVTDKARADPDSLIDVPAGGGFDDLVAVRGDVEIGDKVNQIIAKLAEANDLLGVIDVADFNDEEKLGRGKEMQDRLGKLVAIFADLDFSGSRAEGDDLLGDAYEYLMRHFATESGKSKGQFYTPAEVSRVLARIVGINASTRQDETVYDPTCGSGSLLLKAAAEAPEGITVYGQEKDNDTWALARMNMILHGNEIADIRKGDTLTSPQFTAGAKLRTFDFAVANPPFSAKSWNNGLEQEYGRFAFGRPPEKNGDYAFLLHVLTSLKSTGKAAVILPHGVLFRGHAEASIRRRLLEHGYIKGIVGLPANLFFGTGIPACIVVLDKEGASTRTGVFMIDASKGFTKDGSKNRLRSRDVHKIVDVFNRQAGLAGYARMVPLEEIAGEANAFNLSIPRYVDATVPEDIQDVAAHADGGIPERDIDALQGYWDAFPSLRASLFTPNRDGYLDLAVDVAEVHQRILDSGEFTAMTAGIGALVDEWFGSHREVLEAISKDTRPDELIALIGDDLLARFKPVPLLDEYAVYEQLREYWDQVMHDDVFLLMSAGWVASVLDPVTLASHDEPSVADVKRLLLETKWRAALKTRVTGELQGLVQALVTRVLTLGERYASTAGSLTEELARLQRVSADRRASLESTAPSERPVGGTHLRGATEPWAAVRLGEIATFSKGAGLPKSELVADGEIPCVHYGELFTFYKAEIRRVVGRTHRRPGQVESSALDVLMPTSDVTPSGLAKASVVFEDGVVLGGDILVIRVDPTRLHAPYLAHLIRHDRGQVLALVRGSTIFHVYASDMRNFTLSLPCLAEQRAICDALREADAELDALSAVSAKAEAIKQGMMQGLLTGRTRLPVEGQA